MSRFAFLEQCEPPWVAFRQLQVEELASHLKQGTAEPWFDQKWRPFWASLSSSERRQYLDHWQATPEWREALRFFFEETPDFDAEADLAESEKHLEEFRRRKPKSSLFDRLFRRS